MKRTWFYLLNTFLINTRKAPAKMLRIGNDHDARLSAEVSDPEIEALWSFLHPILVVFQTLFSAWKSSISYRMSMTLTLTKLFKQLGDEWIKAWEGKVYNSFPEGTPEAMAIFPNKRKPFQSGTYEERIIAVNTLAESLAPYAELAALKLDVEAKYTALTKARNIQKQAMASEGKNASDLENQRIEVGDVLYKDLGSLMAKFYKKPTDVERFFNLSLIRRSSSESDGTFSQDGMVGAGASLVVPIPKKFELSISATFIFANSEGGSELHFFFADSAATTDSPNKGVVAPGESLEITAGEMGWSATNTIFIVKNAGGLTAEYELTATE